MSSPCAAVPLIGRDAELKALVELVAIDDPTRAGNALVAGDAGIGKSRLLDALSETATAAGWRVAVGHCLDLGGSPLPYLPFSELVGRLEAARPDTMAALTERYPALLRLLPRRSDVTRETDTMDRGQLMDTVHAALSDLASDKPLLLIVEDLHWADQSTYDLLSFLFTRGFDATVSVVGSYRADDLHRRHPLRTIAAAWSRLPGLGRIDLHGLADQDLRELVRVLHPDPLEQAVVQGIVERSEGNAFFAEELVSAVWSSSVPPDLAGLLLLRVDQLDPDARQVVRTASVAGRVVRDNILMEVSGLPRSRFDDAVRVAVEFNVLRPEPSGYAFRHAMLAEAVYDDLMPGERRAVHIAFVTALTRSGSQGTAADLARHALGADDYATAVHASLRAGDDALSVGGPDEAARHYATALDLLNTEVDGTALDPPVDIVGVAERASSSAAAAGLVHRADRVAADQLARLGSDASPADRARLLMARAEAATLTDIQIDLVALTAEAVALVPAEPPTLLRSRVVASHAFALASDRRDEDALRSVEEALAMPPELRTPATTTQLQTVLARISERGGDAATSIQIMRRVLAETQDTNDPAEVRVWHQLGALHLELGEVREAFDAYRCGAERTVALGRPWAPYGVDSRTNAGITAYQLGDWDTAVQIVDISHEHPPMLATAGLLSVSLMVRAGRGETDRWQDELARIRPEWTTDGMIAIYSTAAAVDLYGAAGDLDSALAIHDEAVACVSELWSMTDFQAQIRLAAVLVGQVADHVSGLPATTRAGFVERAEQIAETGHRADGMGRRRNHRGPESQAWLRRLEAERLRLRHAAGQPVDHDLLVSAWQESVRGFDAYDHPYERARSLVRLAGALRHGPRDAEARSALDDARAIASRLGARPLLAEIAGLSGASGHLSAEAVLTPREAEVLALVAEGRSNKEIGQQLFISTKTASVHVSNILAKLSAATRTEAAAVARRRGLLT